MSKPARARAAPAAVDPARSVDEQLLAKAPEFFRVVSEFAEAMLRWHSQKHPERAEALQGSRYELRIEDVRGRPRAVLLAVRGSKEAVLVNVERASGATQAGSGTHALH